MPRLPWMQQRLNIFRRGSIIELHTERLTHSKGDNRMAADMKESIAQAAKALLLESGIKKLTVKEIVEKCQITRQAFYYHFEDIPALVRWILEQDTKHAMQEFQNLDDGEPCLRYLFVMAINAMPYMKKGMETNYRNELEEILTQHIQCFFEQICDEKNLYQNCTRQEVKWILRYHSQAILGLLRHWTDADTKNLDQIVHIVFQLMTEGISPVRES